MAIWDKKEGKSTLLADARKCFACGDNLKFFVNEGYLQCVSCGSVFYPDTFEINSILEDRVEHEIDFNKEQLDEVTRFSLEKRQEIICNSCGSVVVTGKNTISTYCAFCGSPAIVGRRIQKAFLPDVLIPFKVSREEAEQNVTDWAERSYNTPRSFWSKAKFTKMTSLYVPFWLVDADCEMNVSGQCYLKHNDVEYDEYFVRRRGKFPMRLVPFDGSKRIADNLMEGIEPFDYSEIVDFNDSYLNGVYAERYDQSPSDLALRISNRFRDFMYEVAVDMTENKNYSIKNLKNNYSSSANHKCYYALLPVWLITYEYKGDIYKVAVNGQTGKVAGKVPIIEIKDNSLDINATSIGNIITSVFLMVFFEGLLSLLLLLYTSNVVLTIVVFAVLVIANIVFGTILVREKLRLKKLEKEKALRPTNVEKAEKEVEILTEAFIYIDKSNIKDVERTDDCLGLTQFADNGKGRNVVNIFDME
ncbi:MAG: hypothetical protein MJ093_03285 [Saccharofermentans sp.]|nr:hypothetical protein [Saccharofermentans sp.]